MLSARKNLQYVPMNSIDQKKDSLNLVIAGFVIRIIFDNTERPSIKKSMQGWFLKNFKGFLNRENSSEVDYSIIFAERKKIEFFVKKERIYYVKLYQEISPKSLMTFYTISPMQFQMILSHILEKLLIGSGFLIHASAVKYRSGALLFLAKQGGGKSTIKNLLKARFEIIADDCAILKKENNEFFVYQSPYVEKNLDISKKTAKKYPVSWIFFLNKSRNYKIVPIKNKNYIFQRLLKQLTLNQSELKRQFKHLVELVNKNRLAFLYFAKNRQKVIKLVESL